MLLRPLKPTDEAQWRQLWAGYLHFYKTSVSEEVTQVAFSRLLDETSPQFCYVAVDDNGTLLGLVHYIFHRSMWSVGDYCYLQDLFVLPKMRGKSIGRKLILQVYVEAKAKGASRVHWLTHESNQDAMYLYDQVAENAGFVQYTINIE